MNNNITLYLDDIAIELIYVEGTDENGFMMGGESGKESSLPMHPICLSSYYISKYLVTQALWEKVMKPNLSILQNQKGNNRPKIKINCNEIEKNTGFLSKLNKNKDLIYQIQQIDILKNIFNNKNINKLSFQLPTEAQWEYAARGGKKEWYKNYKYAGSNNPQEVAWYKENSHKEIKPVGLKKPNALGIYDMSGNVWEWCKDWYDGEYYQRCLTEFEKEDVILLNPCNIKRRKGRVVRGSSFFYTIKDTNLLYRKSFIPTINSIDIGFRLVFV